MSFEMKFKSEGWFNVTNRLRKTVRPATEKALEPIRVLVRGMSYSTSVAERRWARPSSTDTGLTMSEIYSDAVPAHEAYEYCLIWIQLKTPCSTPTLNWQYASLKLPTACTDWLNGGLDEHLRIISIQMVRHRVDDILDVFGVCSELRWTNDGALRNAAHQSGWDRWWPDAISLGPPSQIWMKPIFYCIATCKTPLQNVHQDTVIHRVKRST